MPVSANSSLLQRKIIMFSVLGIIIISTITAVVSIFPLYNQLMNEQEKNLVFSAATKTMAIEEFLTRSKDIANQITSRTRLRQALESYNDNENRLTELLPFFNKGMSDALNNSDEVRGITRLGNNGEAVIQLGIVIDNTYWPKNMFSVDEILVEGPVKVEKQSYLIISAPIMRDKTERVGTDIVIFDMKQLYKIIRDYSGLGETGETVIAGISNGNIKPLIPTRHQGALNTEMGVDSIELVDALSLGIKKQSGIIRSPENSENKYVIAYGPVKDSKWGVAVKMDKDELYNSIEKQVFNTVLIIASLIGLGILGLIILLRPLTGKVLLHTSDLEGKIKDKTAELSEQEARIHSIIDTAAEGIICIDRYGIIELFNPAAEKIFGYDSSDVFGVNVNTLMPELYKREHDGYRENSCINGIETFIGTTEREVEGLRKDGTIFPLEIMVSELYVNGERKFTGMMRDITERKIVQEQLNSNYDELQKVNENLKATQSQLLQSEKMASVGQLAAGVAHEINNPVGYINSNVATLKQYVGDLFDMLDAYARLESSIESQDKLKDVEAVKKKVDLQYLRDDIVELIGESQEGVTRVKQIVQDLKDFSHVDGGDWEWADLQKGLDSTVNVARNELKYKAEVIKEYGGIPQIECMPSQLNQVFMNLLVNAAHAIETQGQITIRTGEQDNEVYIAIQDTGKGMSEEVQKRIFEPFYTTKPVGTGTGLGLSLSYGIVEKHGGRIDLQSEADKGTTFTIWLPIQQNENREAG